MKRKTEKEIIKYLELQRKAYENAWIREWNAKGDSKLYNSLDSTWEKISDALRILECQELKPSDFGDYTKELVCTKK